MRNNKQPKNKATLLERQDQENETHARDGIEKPGRNISRKNLEL